MRRDHDEFGEGSSALRDNSSERHEGERPSVDPPYRDRREALVARRRALSREHEDAARAADKLDRIERHLRVIEDELRATAAPLLESIAIARPCSVRWDDMRGGDLPGGDIVRHCGRCDRDVHDISLMSRDQVHALFALADATPCVRLRRRADGRIVTAECPTPRSETAPRALAFAAAGAVFGMTATSALGMLPPLGRDLADGRARHPMVDETPVQRDALAPSDRAPLDPLPEVDVGALRSAPRDEVLMGGAVAVRPEAPLDLDRHVRWTAPQSWEVDRVVIESALADPRALRPPVRLMPHQRGGRIVGARMYGVQRESLLGHLGFRNGDTLLDVNGYELAHPDLSLEAYARLRDAPTLFVRIERNGRERLHVYRIAP